MLWPQWVESGCPSKHLRQGAREHTGWPTCLRAASDSPTSVPARPWQPCGMDDERDRLQREIEHFTALLAALQRYGLDADDHAALLGENIEVRRRCLAEIERRRRMH